jgi:hypothetical protein
LPSEAEIKRDCIALAGAIINNVRKGWAIIQGLETDGEVIDVLNDIYRQAERIQLLLEGKAI